jgi:perosamine synthetase
MQFIPISSSNLTGNEINYLKQCIDTNWISSLGKHVREFENQFSVYTGRLFSLACSSGTTALHLALEALGIGEGDEVIVPAFTFIASVNAILYTGAAPVFVDIEEETWNMSLQAVQAAITPNTKALLVVNIYGNPASMDDLREIARKHELKFIEDNAEALGGEYKGRKLGSFGDISCHSFYGNKLVTCGEGGMVSTDNEEWAETIKMLRDHGMSSTKRYYHLVKGYNYRMTNLQAAVGLAQFERINEFLEERRRIFERYSSQLIKSDNISLPFQGDRDRRPVNWLYTVRIHSKNRDEVAAALKKKGIDSRPGFVPAYKMPYIDSIKSLPVTERVSKESLSLPTYVDLGDEQIDYITKELLKLI